MDHPAGVGVGHRLADLLEDRQEPRQARRPARAGPRSSAASVRPLTSFMAKIRPAVGEGAQLVDRDDAGVLELAADLGLLDEAADQLGMAAGAPRAGP